jgi:hypothetical protein
VHAYMGRMICNGYVYGRMICNGRISTGIGLSI